MVVKIGTPSEPETFPLTSPPAKATPAPEWIAKTLTYKDRTIFVTWPFPDKLDLVTDIKPDLTVLPSMMEEPKTGDYIELFGNLQAWLSGVPLTKNNVVLSDLYPKGNPKQAVFRIYLNDAHDGPFALFSYSAKKGPDYPYWKIKLSLNPARIGTSGWALLRESLENEVAPYLDFDGLLTAFHVTRLDCAVDCIGAYPLDLICHIPEPGKRVLYSSSDGQPESIYLHKFKPPPKQSPKSSNFRPLGATRLRVYDRRAYQIQYAQKPDYGTVPVTRLEIPKSWKSHNPSLAELRDIKSLMLGYRVGYASAGALLYDHAWRDFCYRVYATGDIPPTGLSIQKGDARNLKRFREFEGTVLAESDWEGWQKGLDLTGLGNWVDTY